MTPSQIKWGELVLETIRTPEQAAKQIIDWQLPHVALYQVLFIVSAFNTLLTAFQVSLSDNPGPMGFALTNPFAFFLLSAGVTVVFIHVVFWVGNTLGGNGEFSQLLALLIWLEVLRFGAQSLILIASFLIPALALLLFLAVVILNFWLLLNFLRISLHLNSAWHALGVLFTAIAGMVVGMTLILSLIGLSTLGISTNV